eukprot:GILI01012549.1.p1 GENE.GILI01012549.1~~GILI01012549.1.p1  ORF type:complete len:711 (-),score=202.97 GILI01012549.1:77-2209(-)
MSSAQQKPQSPPTRINNVDLLFEPTGDLEKDYCAYCEIGERNERDDVIDGILREELDTQATPISLMSAHNMSATNAHLGATTGTTNGGAATELGHSDSSPHLTQGYPSQNTMASVAVPSATIPVSAPPVIRTTVNMRNLAYCLNKRDMQPLADAIPHCPSLTAVRMTGCGLTEFSYKQLVEAVYKSGSIHTLAVDMNPDGLFKDPTATKKDRNDINVYAAEFRGAHLKPSDDKEGEGAALATAKRAPPKPSRPVPKKNLAAAAALEAAERTPIPLPTGWHSALLTGIQVLSLRGNGITDAQLLPLCDILASNSELLSLSLWGNKITSAGAIMLAKAIAQNGKLLTLNLGHNLLDDEAVKALMATFLTRDVAYDEVGKLRAKALSLITAASANVGATTGSNIVNAVPPPAPPAETPLYPCYGDFVASAMAKVVEEGTVATIKALGVPISSSTGAAPAAKKKEVAPAGKRKGMGEGPIERPADPFDRDVVRLYEDSTANPATANIISQQLSVATSSGSAAAVQAAIVQLQQLSKFRVPGNTALAALNLSFNPGITAKGVAEATAVIETREPLPETMYSTLVSAAANIDFQPASPQSASANAKNAPVVPSPTVFGTPVPAAIPTAAGQAGLAAPAANASAVASQLQAAIMGAPHLYCLNQTRHYVVHGCALKQLDIESSKIDPLVLQQLQKALKDRRVFVEEARAAAVAVEDQ